MNSGMDEARRGRERGFTAIELAACVVVLLVIGAVLLPAIGTSGCSCCTLRHLKDSTQVRGIVQAMVVWAGNNNGRLPLPSEIDAANATIAAEPWAKDTTGNILSLLIFNGNISSELCVSAAESNTAQVCVDGDYRFTAPRAAASPNDALWDPAFHGTPIDDPNADRLGGVGHNSYAQLLPFGARRGQWADTASMTTAVLGNRGPRYAADDWAPHPTSGRWTLPDSATGTGSNTLLIHGGRTTWEGNIGYGDGHVSFETKPTPDGVSYCRGADPKVQDTPDNLFVNECDEWAGDFKPGHVSRGRNAYLRPIARMAAPDTPVLWVD